MINDYDLTTLLERSVSSAPMSPPPVGDVIARGRRKLCWQRCLQIGGTAAVVAAVAVGAALVHADSGPGTMSAAAGKPPTQANMIGKWLLVSPRPSLKKTGPREDPGLVTFSMQRGQFSWLGYDGCNWISGPVDLGTAGSFRTPENMATTRGCLGISTLGSPLVTGAGVIEKAASVRFEGGDLTFFTSAGESAGTFTRQPIGGFEPLPNQVPSASGLIGHWHWVTKTPPSHVGTQLDPSLLWFTFQNVGLVRPPGHPPVLHWSGYVGCNNVLTGEVHLGTDGAFSTSRNTASDLACQAAPPAHELTVSQVILSARSVRLVDGRLTFYDADQRPVGTFVKTP